MISIPDTKVLNTDRLKKTGEAYSLVLLSRENIDDILKLQEIAFAHLTEAYIHKKSRDFFEKHFAAGNDVIGIVHNGRLIAQSIVVNPSESYPDTGMPMDLESVPLNTLTILQGVIVDPDYRGNNLMGAMVKAWLAASEQKGRTEALAEVVLGNTFSWSVFMQKGLHIENITIDPETQSEVYNLHGHLPALRKAFKRRTRKQSSLRSNIARQKKLVAKGYKGTKFDPAKGKIKFHRPKKGAHCL